LKDNQAMFKLLTTDAQTTANVTIGAEFMEKEVATVAHVPTMEFATAGLIEV
jgi:hypothetical protein